MIQLSADFNLPSLPAGSIMTATAKGKAGAFVDLLGLALEGQLGSTQGTAGTGLPADAALFVGEDAQPTDDLANLLGLDASRLDLAAMLLAGQAAPRPALPSTPVDGSEANSGDPADNTSLLGIALGDGRPKLPAGAAELAALAGNQASVNTAQAKLNDPKALAQANRDLTQTLAANPLDEAEFTEALDAALSEPLQGLPRTTAQAAHVANPVANVEAANASAGAAAMQAAQASKTGDTDPSVPVSPVNLRLVAPLGGAEWRAELGDRIAWMVGRGAQSAELVLNPPALGTIEVKLNMNLAGNEAGAQFFAANANVREALEASFPRLRELLASAGINLGDTSLSSQSFADARQEGQTGQGSGSASSSADGGTTQLAERLQLGSARLSGLVDLFV